MNNTQMINGNNKEAMEMLVDNIIMETEIIIEEEQIIIINIEEEDHVS